MKNCIEEVDAEYTIKHFLAGKESGQAKHESALRVSRPSLGRMNLSQSAWPVKGADRILKWIR